MDELIYITAPENEVDRRMYWVYLGLFLSHGMFLQEAHIESMKRIDTYKN